MFSDLVLKNRSYRSFDMTKRVGEENLRKYVDLARITASTANLQALKYRIVHTEEECEKALSCTKWAGYLKDMQIPPADHNPTGYVVICCDRDITNNVTAFFKDTGIAAQTILLAAAEDGFGGCMIGSVDEAKIKNIARSSAKLIHRTSIFLFLFIFLLFISTCPFLDIFSVYHRI